MVVGERRIAASSDYGKATARALTPCTADDAVCLEFSMTAFQSLTEIHFHSKSSLVQLPYFANDKGPSCPLHLIEFFPTLLPLRPIITTSTTADPARWKIPLSTLPHSPWRRKETANMCYTQYTYEKCNLCASYHEIIVNNRRCIHYRETGQCNRNFSWKLRRRSDSCSMNDRRRCRSCYPIRIPRRPDPLGLTHLR